MNEERAIPKRNSNPVRHKALQAHRTAHQAGFGCGLIMLIISLIVVSVGISEKELPIGGWTCVLISFLWIMNCSSKTAFLICSNCGNEVIKTAWICPTCKIDLKK